MSDNYQWQHPTNGDYFVVTRDSNGRIIAACGPLHYSEILDAIENGFDNDPELVEDIRAIDEAE